MNELITSHKDFTALEEIVAENIVKNLAEGEMTIEIDKGTEELVNEIYLMVEAKLQSMSE